MTPERSVSVVAGEHRLSEKEEMCLKRLWTMTMAVFTLFCCSAVGAKPSLLPFDPRWTVDQVRNSLAEGADVNEANEVGRTPLMEAVIGKARTDVVKALLLAGADLDAKDEWGWTALMRALDKADPEVIEMLIASGAKVNASSGRGQTPLMIAAERSALEVINMLLQAGASANARDYEGSTLLMYAVWNPNADVTRSFIALGCDVNARTLRGETALMHASSESNAETLKILIEHGADLNAREDWYGYAPLMIAAQRTANPEIVKTLLKAGANGRLKSYEGKTAFDYARDNDSIRLTDAYWLLNDTRF